MAREAVFSMKLGLGLRSGLMAEAWAAYRPAPQVLRALTRDFVHRQRVMRKFIASVGGTVDAGRVWIRLGVGRCNGMV